MKRTRRPRPSIRKKRHDAPTLESIGRALAGARKKPRAASRTRSRDTAPEAIRKLRKIPDLGRAKAQQLLRIALAEACGSSDRTQKSILWRDGDDELLLHVSRTRVAMAARLIVICIPVFTDQSGEAEVVVPFVTNTATDPVGLIAATETRPRGPAAVVDVFGESLVAVAWAALVNAAAAWTAAVGQKGSGIALVPAGLSATKFALRVSAQPPSDEKSR